ncbi:uncharacterized protein LOC135823986 isoform X2 [Sycon ciliatum]|uniref:uncharacterized protein LOC135823986 isoform X2 n=1 Tax=Sycon ciliatum TaxID=27933 RepID=UPI0031F6BC47
MSGMEWRYWPASILPVVCVLIATMQQLQTCSAQVVHIEDVVNATIRLGCYNNTAKDDLAVGTASQFHWSSNRLPSNQDLQSGSSPFYSYKVKEQDDGLQITCVIDITSSLFNERLKDHPELISVRPPTYRVAVLVPLFYNPSLAPNPTPEPCSLVTCPYSGSGVTTTFTMNTTGPFDCEGNCFSCNSSCKNIGVTPAEENMCFSARDVDCFTPVAGESNKVIIKRDCYGCLRCDASNTVKGITRREKFSFNLNRPTASACGPCNAAYDGGAYRPDSNTPLVVSPSANATLGIDTLTISFLFQSKYAVSIRVYNGSDGRRLYFSNPGDSMDFRTSLELLSFEDCRFKYTLTMRRPQVWVSHIWAFLFRWQSDTDTVTPAPIRQLWQNVSISLTERKCDNNEKNCPNGQCVLDWSNHPSCVCPYHVYGTTCQLSCPKSNGATTPLVDAEIIIPVGCYTVVVLVCPLAVTNTGLLYSWRQNGQLKLKGPSTFTVASDSIGRDRAGNYSCYLASNNTYLGSVLVYIADNPVLVNRLTNNTEYHVRNESQTDVVELAVNVSGTYNASSVQYSWMAVDKDGGLCNGSLDLCIVDRTNPLLQILFLPCCSGSFRGCATNDYGKTCTDVRVRIDSSQDDCPIRPQFTGFSNGTVNFIGSPYTRIIWTKADDPEVTATTDSRSISTSCCCHTAQLTDVPTGTYIACFQPSSDNDTNTVCYPQPIPYEQTPQSSNTTFRIAIGASLGGLALILCSLLFYICWRYQKSERSQEDRGSGFYALLPEDDGPGDGGVPHGHAGPINADLRDIRAESDAVPISEMAEGAAAGNSTLVSPTSARSDSSTAFFTPRGQPPDDEQQGPSPGHNTVESSADSAGQRLSPPPLSNPNDNHGQGEALVTAVQDSALPAMNPVESGVRNNQQLQERLQETEESGATVVAQPEEDDHDVRIAYGNAVFDGAATADPTRSLQAGPENNKYPVPQLSHSGNYAAHAGNARNTANVDINAVGARSNYPELPPSYTTATAAAAAEAEAKAVAAAATAAAAAATATAAAAAAATANVTAAAAAAVSPTGAQSYNINTSSGGDEMKTLRENTAASPMHTQPNIQDRSKRVSTQDPMRSIRQTRDDDPNTIQPDERDSSLPYDVNDTMDKAPHGRTGPRNVD